MGTLYRVLGLKQLSAARRYTAHRRHEGEDRLMDAKAGGNGRADQAGPAAVETCGGGWHVADLGRLVAETSAKGALASADSFCH